MMEHKTSYTFGDIFHSNRPFTVFYMSIEVEDSRQEITYDFAVELKNVPDNTISNNLFPRRNFVLDSAWFSRNSRHDFIEWIEEDWHE